MDKNIEKIYEIIDTEADNNVSMQGLSGLLGFPFTLLTDIGVVFVHYGPMFNKIRGVYGFDEVGAEVLGPIIKGYSSEIIQDMVLDKIIGQIPVIGIGANIICAKAMTWRLGILFGMLSISGCSINESSVKECAKLIREIFPQKDLLTFKKPQPEIVEKILKTVEGDNSEAFKHDIETMLDNIDSR